MWASVGGGVLVELERDVRVARASGDVGLLARVVAAPGIERHLQAAGEALLAVRELHADADETADSTCRRIARDLATLLSQRDWTGDTELADLLLAPYAEQASSPPGATSTRRPIRADLEQVADLLEGGLEMGFGGVLDMQTGDAWPELMLEDWSGDEPRPDPDAMPERYVFVPSTGSRDAWRDMRDFALSLADHPARQQLLDAIEGRGAFGRFKRVLDHHDELRSAWHAYSNEARCGRARAWLHDAGYDAFPPSR